MADEIRADYDQLNQVASKFANQANIVRDISQKLRRSMDPLQQGGWIGLGHDAFFGEMDAKVLPSTKRLHEALTEAESITKQIAKHLREQEEAAANLFKATPPAQ